MANVNLSYYKNYIDKRVKRKTKSVWFALDILPFSFFFFLKSYLLITFWKSRKWPFNSG